MDILGKQGEEAREELDNVSRRIQKLESHLDAVDSALSDFMDDSLEVMQQEQRIDKAEAHKIEELGEEERIDELEERVSLLEDGQETLKSKLQELVGSELLDTVSGIDSRVRAVRNRLKELEDLEDRLNELENNVILEINSREFDFDRKLDKREFEDSREEFYEEIRKLRASVNVLADELDKKAEIEERL